MGKRSHPCLIVPKPPVLSPNIDDPRPGSCKRWTQNQARYIESRNTIGGAVYIYIYIYKHSTALLLFHQQAGVNQENWKYLHFSVLFPEYSNPSWTSPKYTILVPSPFCFHVPWPPLWRTRKGWLKLCILKYEERQPRPVGYFRLSHQG